MIEELLSLEPVLLSESFVGRSDEITQLAGLLGSGNPQNCNVVGEPRIGRTSLLYHVYVNKIGAHGEDNVYVWVALAELAEYTSPAFWRHLWGAIRTTLPTCGNENAVASSRGPEPKSEEVEQAWAASRAIQEALDKFSRATQGNGRVVLVVDDMDLVLPFLSEGDLARLRSLTTRFSRCFAFVMSSAEPLMDILRRLVQFRAVTSSLFREFREVRSALLTRGEAEQLVAQAAAAMDLTEGYGDDERRKDTEFLLREAGRHPALLKIACRHLLGARRGYMIRGGSEPDYDDARFDIRDDSQVRSLCELLLERHTRSEEQARLLRRLADGGVRTADGTTGLPDEERRILRKLMRIGLVEQTDSEYRLFAEAFAEYVREGLSSAPAAEVIMERPSAEWEYFPERRVVVVNGVERGLSSLEYRLLDYLYTRANTVCTTEEIKNSVWGPGRTDSVVEKGINRLRNKVETMPSQPHYIVNARGEGYMLRLPIRQD